MINDKLLAFNEIIVTLDDEKFVNSLIDDKVIEAVASVFDGKEDENTQV